MATVNLSEPRMPTGDGKADLTYLFIYITSLVREIKWAIEHIDEDNIIKNEAKPEDEEDEDEPV